MGRSPLTLAALATNAVAGLDVTSVARFSRSGAGEYDSVLLSAPTGARYLFRTPTSPDAATRQETELRALGAFSPGIRARLPFALPRHRGHTEVGPTIGMLYDYVDGDPFTRRDLHEDGALARSVGRAIAAVHQLPTSFVDDYALPHENSHAVADLVSGVMDRATATGRVPDVVARRWEQVLAAPYWDFSPTVIHGDLTVSSFLAEGEVVSGVLGWERLRIGDPATDLAWFIDLPGASRTIFAEYLAARGVTDDAIALRSRASLHRELGLARWLLQGVADGDAAVIDDGTAMLRGLATEIENGTLGPIVPVNAFDDDADVPATSAAVGDELDASASAVTEPDSGTADGGTADGSADEVSTHHRADDDTSDPDVGSDRDSATSTELPTQPISIVHDDE